MPYNNNDIQTSFDNFDREATAIEENTNFRNTGEVITSILKVINCLLHLTPALKLPPFLTYLAARRRSGVLSDTIVSNIYSKLSDDGVNIVGDLPDGSPNVMEKVIGTIVDEIVNELVLNNSVQSEIPVGGVSIPTPYGVYTNVLPINVLGMWS